MGRIRNAEILEQFMDLMPGIKYENFQQEAETRKCTAYVTYIRL